MLAEACRLPTPARRSRVSGFALRGKTELGEDCCGSEYEGIPKGKALGAGCKVPALAPCPRPGRATNIFLLNHILYARI